MPSSLFSNVQRYPDSPLAKSAMPHLVAHYDWSSNSLGPIETWSASFRSAARLVLSAAIPMGVIAGEHGILIFNDGMREIMGAPFGEALGMSVLDALPHAAAFYRDAISKCSFGAAPSYRDSPLKITRDGKPVTAWFNLEFTPVLAEDGTYLAALVIATETTLRVIAERALQRSEERLSLALGASGVIGIWDLDLLTGQVTADERFAKVFGITPADAAHGLPINRFLESIHPDDRARVLSGLSQATATGQKYQASYRLITRDGGVRWLLASGRTIFDDGGRPVRFPGVAVDITRQFEDAVALAESESHFRTLAETVPQMVWSANEAGIHDYFSQRWYEFTGLSPGPHEHDRWRERIHPDDRERVNTVWREANHSAANIYDNDYRFLHHSGQHRWIHVTALPQRDSAGAIVRWYGTATDIHDAKIAAHERELVSDELNHRIKNIFAITQSLISLSVHDQPEMKDFADGLASRLKALHQAHDFIRPDAGARVALEAHGSLHSLIRLLLKPYEGSHGARIIFEGPDCPIGERAVTPLSLLFHELATNSAKYGALSSSAGTLRLLFVRGAEQWQISWIENQQEANVPPPEQRGFGSRLLTLIVNVQLQGQISRHWTRTGLHLTITLPVQNIERAGNALH